MSRFFKRLSFASRHSRPAGPSSSSEPQDSSASLQVPNMSRSLSRPALSQQRVTELYEVTLKAINDRWIEGLTEFTKFDLHGALSTFKSLLRSLRSPANDHPSGSTDDDEPPPYRFLLPEEVALLYINIGIIHGYLGSHYLAAAAFDEALLLDEASAIAWFGLGIARCYMQEMRASKLAFRQCRTRFATYDYQGNTYLEDITYRVWTGQDELEKQRLASWYAALNNNQDPTDISSTGLLPKDYFPNAFPTGTWKLESSVVRINHRKMWLGRIGQPAHWSPELKGIPVGVIFGLDIEARKSLANSNNIDGSSSNHFIKKHSRGNSTETIIPFRPSPVRESRGIPANFVKQKWAAIQQRLRSRTADPAAMARLLASPPPNAPAPAGNPNHRATSVSSGRTLTRPTQEPVDHQHTRARSASLPSSSFNNQVTIPNRFEDALSEGDDHSVTTFHVNIGTVANPDLPSNHPAVYLTSQASSTTHEWHQGSERVSVMANMQNIRNIQEVLDHNVADGDIGLANSHHPNAHSNGNIQTQSNGITQYPQHHQTLTINHDTYYPPNTPGAMSPITIQPGDTIPLPNLLHDLTTDDTYTLPATTYNPLPRTNLSDSFMTDTISSLASHDRSHMFPSLDSAPSSRRPSSSFAPESRRPSTDYPATVNHASRSSTGTIIWNPAYEEAYEHLSGRRTTVATGQQGPALAITPATPTRTEGALPDNTPTRIPDLTTMDELLAYYNITDE
ncbi:MAG: hypothetical protein Q9218_003473, partial [Villophora microphyllina]